MSIPQQQRPDAALDARIADAEYTRDHQDDGLTDDEAAQIAQDRYERTVLGWGCD